MASRNDGILHFPGRDVPPYAEAVPEGDLVVGRTYFSVHFCDERTLDPELEALVFLGENLYPEHQGYYFQDACSHRAGVPYDAEAGHEDSPTLHCMPRGGVHVMDFEHALDVLLHTSLRRREKS